MNKRLLLSLVTLFIGNLIHAQNVVINELDSRNPGVDTAEFIELKTQSPNTPLDGYVMVLFNGSSSGGNSSYYTLDLDGFVTDFNGLFVIGGADVSPSPNFIVSQNTFQNGVDAVGIYVGNDFDYPDGTLATTANLEDALVYSHGQSDGQDLPGLLDFQGIINENTNGEGLTQSIQRADDGSWFVADPTPRQPNQGGGTDPIFIDVITDGNTVNEGEDFTITIETSQTLPESFTLNYTLANGDFDQNDFTGSTTLTINQGEDLASVTINITDDDIDEGDEVMLISIDEPNPPYVLLQNEIEIIVIDNDFVVADWGSPVNPTFDEVNSTAPAGYYDAIDGKSGQELIDAIQDIIAEEGVVRIHTYTDIIDILKEADQSPDNSNQVWLIYREENRAKYMFQTGSTGTTFWNREHVFPRSRGGFFSIEDDGIATGINFWWNTNADSLRHGNSDAHALRAADANENSSRGNKHYGDYTGPTNNVGSFYGDVARSAFYMAIRFNDLDVADGFPTETGFLGDLTILLDWHELDPADDFEMNRNNVIYEWQQNRNPFIDFPELVDYIWGDKQGDVWNNPLSTFDEEFENFSFYPNPSTGKLNIKGLETGEVEVFDVQGKSLQNFNINGETSIDLNLSSGIYLLRFTSNSTSTVERLIIK
ncbi:endonuclease [Psychroflexus planctonicus]|uniref:Ribonuclease n=1 Tax=Psychroflexus planctonicus TaxID=1526575 RepID=A0ABQ1SJW3_9FLAO|nr:endonuclease [Psychroflexus planctonicus]GGE43616.1 ribonuclease [Psychroflexus planctonicus]